MVISFIYMKNKALITIGIFGSGLFLYFIFVDYSSIAEAFQIFPILLIFATVFYFWKLRVSNLWNIFSYIYIPISIFLVLLAPEYGSPFLKIEKDTVALFLDSFFIFSSLIMALVAIFYNRRWCENCLINRIYVLYARQWKFLKINLILFFCPLYSLLAVISQKSYPLL